MVLRLDEAVTVLSKWKDDSAHVLVVSESPFQQSGRGTLRAKHRLGDRRAGESVEGPS